MIAPILALGLPPLQLKDDFNIIQNFISIRRRWEKLIRGIRMRFEDTAHGMLITVYARKIRRDSLESQGM